MKVNLRWQILLAVLGFALVLSLLSLTVPREVASGTVVPGEVAPGSAVCQAQVPVRGGVFAEGFVGVPRYLNPLLSDGNPVDREISALLFDGLTRYDASGQLVPDLGSWVVGEDGRTVRFTLFEGKQWHDGEPVTAVDVVYTYSLMQDEAFSGSPDLKTLWQSVTINQIDAVTVEFVLSEPYAPFLAATTRGLLPAHLLQGVTAVSLPNHPFNNAPVGTGPLRVDETVSWRENGRLRLLTSPAVWPQGVQLDAIDYRFYPDEATMLADFAAGTLQAVNHLPDSALPEMAALPQARLFTARDERYTTLLFNVTNSAQGGVNTVEMRRSLAVGLNRDLLVDRVLQGQGIVFEGPYLPSSWAYQPDLLTQYGDGDRETAVSQLEIQGWVLLADGGPRQKEGALLQLRLAALEQQQPIAAEVARQWAEIGVGVELTLLPDVASLRSVLAERAFDVALFDVVPGGDPDLYDFWSQEAMVRGQNYAGWNNRRASESLESARQLWSVAERRPFYDTFLRLFDNDLPAFSLYQHVHTYAVRSEVEKLDIGQIRTPRDRYHTLADWFMLYEDVVIACPTDAVSR